MQRLIISLKFVNSICDNFQFLLCVGGLSQITSDQEDESIWKILAIENQLQGYHAKTTQPFFKSYCVMIPYILKPISG